MAEAEYDRLVEMAACGDAAAADFLRCIVAVAHVWDDLVDRDKPVDDDTINHAFEAALLHIPGNPFYQRHQPELHALLHNSIRNWRLATRIERDQDPLLLPTAFVLRSGYADIFAHVAYLMGGSKLALTVAHEARSQCHVERFSGYVTNLAAERAARSG